MKSKTFVRKKTNKRSNHSSSSRASMPSPKFCSSFKIKRASLLISVPVLCVILVSAISWNMREKTSFRIPSSKICSIEVVNQFPHDPRAFTQGLLYAGNDTLFESTGLHGESSVRKVALQTGKVMAMEKMEYSYFGEGLTLLGDRFVNFIERDKRSSEGEQERLILISLCRETRSIACQVEVLDDSSCPYRKLVFVGIQVQWLFQVTWLRQTGFIYDRNNLSKVKQFSHQMQDGWGLATDGKVLFGSDGTSTLYQIDPQTFKVLKKQTVRYKDQEVQNLNELEFVNGEVWANIWQVVSAILFSFVSVVVLNFPTGDDARPISDCIARISQESGNVVGWILLPNLREGLLAAGVSGIDVLNGIAWDNEKNRIFGRDVNLALTGKLWPMLYEIKLQPLTKPFCGDVEQLCMRRPFNFIKP
ncbi:Glutaminyl-peptide cyclotransferase [Dillenia turbinata]|uniref:Glutaminyl-peptide cyclotransferase n=1 Tax=Dillenia turbinata TaxID=194707 RepID=A0AAN8VVZ1_9MAGN